MLHSSIKTAWYQFVKGCLSSEWTVTWANQPDDSPRPPKPYVTLNIIAGPQSKFARNEKRFIDGEPNAFLVDFQGYTISITAYGSDFHDALSDVKACIDDPDKSAVLRTADISVTNKGGVGDISGRLPTGYESRGFLDILFNSSNNKSTGIGTIESVNVQGNLESANGNIIQTNQTITKE